MSPDASPASESTKAADAGAASVAVTVAVQAATSATSASPEEKATRTLVVDAETTAPATQAMEMDDESFHGDATAFTMSLDELADANPPDQLYEDLTGERVKMSSADCTITTSHDNQIDHEHDSSQVHQSPSRQPTESSSDQPPAVATRAPTPTKPAPVKTEARQTPPTPQQPPVATRKSPRRSAPSAKASAATIKKTASGTKRGNQSQSPAMQAFSWNDILHVQNLIERCLQQLLSKNDIVLTLQAQANVDPSFTVVVWQKLEEQNPAFFKAYAMQLQLKEQITAFNFLVSQQKEMMAKASGNAAFLSFLASSDARKTQRQAMVRPSRMASATQVRGRTNTPSPHPNTIQLGTSTSRAPTSAGMDSLSSSTSQGFPLPSPLPLPSPMKTDLDTHAFFS